MLLFILITLFFVRASTAKCIEKQQWKRLDCAGMSLKTTERLLHGAKPWVYVVDLRRNLLVWINDTLLLSVFPNLQLVDLRENPNLDCRLILELKISVRSECKTKAFLSTRQSLLQTTSLAVPSTTLSTPQSLLQTTSLAVPSTTLSTPQSLLQTTSLAVPSTTLSTPQSLLQTTSLAVPSTTLSTPQSLLQTTSFSPSISMTLEQNHTFHSPRTAKDSELLLIISVTTASTIGFFVLLLCFYGCYRFHPRWSAWLRHRRASLHVQPPSQIEMLSVAQSENDEDIRTRAVTDL